MPRDRKKAKNTANDGGDGDGPQPTTKAKKRRTSSAASGASNQSNASGNSGGGGGGGSSGRGTPGSDLAPPPPHLCYGETIIAANPFDDTPHHHSNMSSQPGTPGTPGPGPMGQMPPQGLPQQGPQGQGHPHPGQHQGPPHSGPQGGPQQGQPQGQQPGSKPVPMMSGKVYPSDQPRVFNPANPNAPPIYPCGICHKEVHDNDQAILCESGCNFWFHRACTGLSEYAFHLLNEEIYAEWACDTCQSMKCIPLVKFKP